MCVCLHCADDQTIIHAPAGPAYGDLHTLSLHARPAKTALSVIIHKKNEKKGKTIKQIKDRYGVAAA